MGNSERRHAQRGGIDSVPPSVRLLLAILSISLFAAVQRLDAAAKESSSDTANSLPQGQEDAKRWFVERYAEVSARLNADPSPLHGRARYRQFHGGEPDDWTTLEFFVAQGRVRVQRDFGPSKGGNAKPPDALLFTPETAAMVVDPGTEFALATELSEKPSAKISGLLWAYVGRLLGASHCVGKEPLSEHLASDFILESVERDTTNDGLVHVRCRRRVTSPTGKGSSKNATVDLWLDANQDFVIRKSRSVFDEPYALELVTEVSSYVQLPNGAWLPNAYSESAYVPATTPGAPSEPSGEPGVLKQRVEYELLDPIKTTTIPDSCFKLESLGIYPAGRHLKLWLLIAASAGLLLIVLLATRKNRARTSVDTRCERSPP